ncbi:MAG: cytochrome c oxidase assembly protein [Paraperlucidibaca sp.]
MPAPQKRQLRLLLLSVVGMFIFAVFLMPPLYDAFCELTGLNGKPNSTAAAASREVDLNRTITVEFLTSVDAGLPWQFKGERNAIDVHPGQINTVSFEVVNNADEAVIGRAIPSISPALGASHLKKTECFCFREQTLQAGQTLDMPVVFYIDPDLPKSVKTITLAYRFYRHQDQTL